MDFKAAGDPQTMSGLMKGGIGALGGASILAAAALFGFRKEVLLILVAAMVLILVILLAYALLLKWLAARRSNPFTQTVQRAAGDTPNAISSPGSRAKLDDLRRNFEAGVTKYRAAGKDLYKLPWYLLVGEPGSGKTEAIRHSSIPFPPGLQDQLQGSGGTVNMNWWFTNDAVILDTAGRYMFDEVRAGASGEWTEFLKLLLANRPQCPINGLLLVIPANSLILDTADQIEAKGGQIAQQLDRIQRVLEVRFPVYIVVTKCDLINGFREFFDGLNDPRLQHQILGWSNPAPLDQAFNPELVDEHLKTVQGRLSQRRLGLLLDPVARESEQGRRLDEVDSLYSMPDSFVRLAPRLRRYLEMVFVAGEWSPKPLFLRGIYFTSSMREGQALDKELADLLRVPVESLPEHRMWERDRAFFLRDLFLKKVFPEKGLVTRAVSTARLQRVRKLAVLGGGFGSAIVLLFFTWFGMQKLKQSITNQGAFWQELADKSENLDLAVIAPIPLAGPGKPTTAPAYRSRLDEQIPKLGADTGTLGQFYGGLYSFEQAPIYVHPIFMPAARLLDSTGNLNQKKAEDYRKIYLANVLAPLIDGAGRQLAAQDLDRWDSSSAAALAQLVRCRAGNPIALDPLLRYVAPDSAASARFKDSYFPALEKGLALVQSQGKAPLTVPDSVLKVAAGRFIEHWNRRVAAAAIPFKSFSVSSGGASVAQTALGKMEQACQGICRNPPHVTDEYESQLKAWRDAWSNYGQACKELDAHVADLGGGDAAASLTALYAARKARAQDDATADFNLVLAEFPAPTTQAAESGAAATDGLSIIHQQLQQARDALAKTNDAALVVDLKKLDNGLLKAIPIADGRTVRSYALIQQLYQTADAQLLSPGSLASAQGPADTDDFQARLTSARGNIDGLQKLSADDDSVKSAGKNSNVLLGVLAEPALRFQFVYRRLEKAPATPDAIKTAVAALAAQDTVKYKPLSLPPVSFVTWKPLQPGFHPDAASDYLAGLKPLLGEASVPASRPVTSDCDAPSVLNARDLSTKGQACKGAINAYVGYYITYWESYLPRPGYRADAVPGVPTHDLDWAGLRQKLPLGASGVETELGQSALFLASAAHAVLPLKPYFEPGTAARTEQLLAEAENASTVLKNCMANPGADPFANGLKLWQDLGDDPAAARTAILNLSARSFADLYMLVQVEGNDFVTRYWRSLFDALLQSLIGAPNPAVDQIQEFLKKSNGFPLGAGDKESTQKDIDTLRSLLPGVIPPSTTSTGKPDDPILSGGRLVGDPAKVNPLNKEFAALVEGWFGHLPPEEQTRLRQLERLLSALPTANDQWSCQILIPSIKKRAELVGKFGQTRPPAEPQMYYLQVEANQKLVDKPTSIRDGPEHQLGEYQYPGDPLRFALYVLPSSPKPEQFIAPPNAHAGDQWQCLKFLTGNAHLNPEDPTAYYVELTPSFRGSKYSLWVMLKFKKAIPEYQDWPKW